MTSSAKWVIHPGHHAWDDKGYGILSEVGHPVVPPLITVIVAAVMSNPRAV